MHEVNVYARAGKHGRAHWQYDFRVSLPDGSIYRERRKARGATSESAARRVGEARLLYVIRQGPPASRRPAAPPERRTPTVAELATEWLDLCRSERQSPCTLRNKEIMLERHLLPLVGALKIDAISEQQIAAVRKQRAELKSSTLNLVLRTLLTMLRCAERLGYKVTIPRVKPLAEVRDRHWYTPEQYEQLVASAAMFGLDHVAVILLGGDAGLRSGEITALRWEDVDFDLDTLHVRRNHVRGEERAPKCSKSREVPMSARLREALLALREREPEGHVLQRDDGRPCPNYLLARRIARAADYAKLPAYGPHALRHAFGSRLMLSGAGARVVMELLGHSNLQTTQVYTHATADHRRAAIAQLAALRPAPARHAPPG